MLDFTCFKEEIDMYLQIDVSGKIQLALIKMMPMSVNLCDVLLPEELELLKALRKKHLSIFWYEVRKIIDAVVKITNASDRKNRTCDIMQNLYDLSQLRASIRRACYKYPVFLAMLEKIINEIVSLAKIS